MWGLSLWIYNSCGFVQVRCLSCDPHGDSLYLGLILELGLIFVFMEMMKMVWMELVNFIDSVVILTAGVSVLVMVMVVQWRFRRV